MKNIRSSKLVYIDCFSIQFLILNFKVFFNNDIIVIDEFSRFNRSVIRLLNFLGFSISGVKFVAGHLDYENENVFLKAREIAGKLSIDCSREIVLSSDTILSLDKNFKEGTIELYISRYLQLYIEKWIMKILVIKSVNRLSNSDFQIFLCRPYIFDSALITRCFPDLNISFYSSNILGYLKLFSSFFSSKLSVAKFIFHALKSRSKSVPSETQSSVLCLQNDTSSLNRKKRAEPHWVDLNSLAQYSTYILSFGYRSSPQIADEEKLSQNNCYVVYPSVFLSAFKASKNNEVLQFVWAAVRKTNFKYWFSKNYAEKYHLLQINKLLLKSYIISAIAIDLKTKVFIVNEPQSLYSDALLLVSEKLAISSIALQYSNMNMISPLMMSNANVFCVFSEIYMNVFSYKNIRPENYLLTGYIYNGLRDCLAEESDDIRKYFRDYDVDYVVSYFDENIQYGKWALYDETDHLHDIETLASAVLENKELGIIIKTQFNYNSPAILYPNNKIIKQAINTGRLIEIKSGVLRNDTYACEAALASDLCIGHSYGGTASLEAAVYGVRSVLIADNYISTRWDYLYSQSNIIYDSLESIIKDVTNNKTKDKSIGDWSGIIDTFDFGRNYSAREKLKNLITGCLN